MRGPATTRVSLGTSASPHAHGCSISRSCAETAQRRIATSQRGSSSGSSNCSTTRSTMAATSSPLFATWLYSDIASTSSAWPSLRMLSASMPSVSASAIAFSSTRYLVSGLRLRGLVATVLTSLRRTSSLRHKLTAYREGDDGGDADDDRRDGDDEGDRAQAMGQAARRRRARGRPEPGAGGRRAA